VSSQNARRHGLSAKPNNDLVAAWFNIILINCEDALEEPNANDRRREATLRPAIAEARYQRALHKVDTHDREPNWAQQVANKLNADVRFVLDRLPERVVDGPADPLDLEFAEFGLRQVEKLLGEARAQRAKALRAWCAFNREENLNSRNKLKLQFKGE
jgi:hypothetical protein